jgi:hypothetical protein
MIKIPKPYKYPVNEEDIKKAMELDYLLEEIKSNEFYEQQRGKLNLKSSVNNK